jgi:hypothetical protein
MSFPDLIIGGIVVPRRASLKISQDYQPFGSASLLRMGDGSGLIQSSDWQKVRTTINFTGWSPTGLDGINWRDPAGVTIACITPLSMISESHVITIPGTIRADHYVLGYAMLGSSEIETTVEMVGNVATLNEVEGATAYKVRWLPVLTCFCDGGIRPSYTSDANEFGCSLSGEEL